MSDKFETMGQNPVKSEGKYRYIVYETEEKLWDKPEHMTQLLGNVLVSKTHPRIDFRGKLDHLQGEVLEIQHRCLKTDKIMAGYLGEVLDRCRKTMTTEALETPLEDINLFGLDEKALRAQSHHPKKFFGVDHPYPNAEMSMTALKLNTLRTQVRQTELAAVLAHEKQEHEWQKDILREMNRLSSGIYILYCRQVASDLGVLPEE